MLYGGKWPIQRALSAVSGRARQTGIPFAESMKDGVRPHGCKGRAERGFDLPAHPLPGANTLNRILNGMKKKLLAFLCSSILAAGLASRAVAADASASAQALRCPQGKVLAVVSNEVVIVSLGFHQGLKTGDKLDLYETMQITNSTRTVVFTDEKLVGEIVLQCVQASSSKASYSGNATVKEDWVVKAK